MRFRTFHCPSMTLLQRNLNLFAWHRERSNLAWRTPAKYGHLSYYVQFTFDTDTLLIRTISISPSLSVLTASCGYAFVCRRSWLSQVVSVKNWVGNISCTNLHLGRANQEFVGRTVEQLTTLTSLIWTDVLVLFFDVSQHNNYSRQYTSISFLQFWLHLCRRCLRFENFR